MSEHTREQTFNEITPLFTRQSSYHSISVQLEDEKEFNPESFYKLQDNKVTVIPIKQLGKVIQVLKKLLKKPFWERLDDFFGQNQTIIYISVLSFIAFIADFYVISAITQYGENSVNNWKNTVPPGKTESCALTYKNQANCFAAPTGYETVEIRPDGVPFNDSVCFDFLNALCSIVACGKLITADVSSKTSADECKGATPKAKFTYALFATLFAYIFPTWVDTRYITPRYEYYFGTYSQRAQNRHEKRRESFLREEPVILQETQLQEYSNSNLEEVLQKATEALNSTSFFAQRHGLIKAHIPEAGKNATDLASIVDEYLGVHLIQDSSYKSPTHTSLTSSK